MLPARCGSAAETERTLLCSLWRLSIPSHWVCNVHNRRTGRLGLTDCVVRAACSPRPTAFYMRDRPQWVELGPSTIKLDAAANCGRSALSSVAALIGACRP